MNRLPLVILLVVVLVAMVTGCGDAPRYDSRLTAADSLMNVNHDSALAIVMAVNPDSLATEGDRAYRDLLLTQARYKCYEHINDSDDRAANRALDYYRHHSGEREKLTRAYIYKGAVVEALDHPDSAMLYYKQAEATAAPDDYFNLGYSNLRMGYLYGQHFSFDKDVEKYEKAVDYFSHTNDTNYQIISLNNLGCVYRESKPAEALSIFQKASLLAYQIDDTASQISIAHSMMVLNFHQKRYQEARRLAQEISDFQVDGLNYMLYFCAANVYARLGERDSANMYLELGKQNADGNEALYRMEYLNCLSELSLAGNDSLSYLRYSEQSQLIADSLKMNETKHQLLGIDNRIDKEIIIIEQDRYIKTKKILLLSLFTLTLLFLVWIYWTRHRYDKLISEIRVECTTPDSDLAGLSHRINELQIQDTQLKDFIESHTNMMREIIEACYHNPRTKLTSELSQIIKYQDKNKFMWSQLYHFIDMKHNNIMKHTKADYPQLNDKDMLLLALTCLDYSCAQIAIIMNYTNSTTVSSIRQRLAKKMGLSCTLKEYVGQFHND